MNKSKKDFMVCYILVRTKNGQLVCIFGSCIDQSKQRYGVFGLKSLFFESQHQREVDLKSEREVGMTPDN